MSARRELVTVVYTQDTTAWTEIKVWVPEGTPKDEAEARAREKLRRGTRRWQFSDDFDASEFDGYTIHKENDPDGE